MLICLNSPSQTVFCTMPFLKTSTSRLVKRSSETTPAVLFLVHSSDSFFHTLLRFRKKRFRYICSERCASIQSHILHIFPPLLVCGHPASTRSHYQNRKDNLEKKNIEVFVFYIWKTKENVCQMWPSELLSKCCDVWEPSVSNHAVLHYTLSLRLLLNPFELLNSSEDHVFSI